MPIYIDVVVLADGVDQRITVGLCANCRRGGIPVRHRGFGNRVCNFCAAGIVFGQAGKAGCPAARRIQRFACHQHVICFQLYRQLVWAQALLVVAIHPGLACLNVNGRAEGVCHRKACFCLGVACGRGALFHCGINNLRPCAVILCKAGKFILPVVLAVQHCRFCRAKALAVGQQLHRHLCRAAKRFVPVFALPYLIDRLRDGLLVDCIGHRNGAARGSPGSRCINRRRIARHLCFGYGVVDVCAQRILLRQAGEGVTPTACGSALCLCDLFVVGIQFISDRLRAGSGGAVAVIPHLFYRNRFVFCQRVGHRKAGFCFGIALRGGGLLHGVNNVRARAVFLRQVFKAACPLVCVAGHSAGCRQGQGLTLNLHTIRVKLQCDAVGAGAVKVAVIHPVFHCGHTAVCCQGIGNVIPAVNCAVACHRRFLHGIGNGVACKIRRRQVRPLVVPICAGDRFACHLRPVCEQVYRNAGRAGIVLVV